MARYDASSAEILVFTFKEGLLSAVAHDLKLKATKFTLEVEGDTAKLELDAASLKVVSPLKDGRDNPSAIPQLLWSEIEKNMNGEVLESKRHPRIEFVTTRVTQTEVEGRLTLHGQTHEVVGTRSGRSAEFRFAQRRFGIKPFSAMLGTLKVKDEVRVRVTIPA